jgi:hypothetical protein
LALTAILAIGVGNGTLWLRTLRRRSQKDNFSWERMTKLADDFLPQPKILHPWPSVRFAVSTRGGSRMP